MGLEMKNLAKMRVMLPIVPFLADELAKKNIKLTPYHNSLITGYKELTPNSELIAKALTGFSMKMVNTVNRYRNLYLPIAKDIESKTSEIMQETPVKSSIKNYDVDVITLPRMVAYYLEKDNVLDISNVTLPEKPLIINLPIDMMRSYLKPSSPILKSYLEEVTHEYTEDELFSLVSDYLSNISSTSSLINDLFINRYDKLNLVIILKHLVTNMLENGYGKSNMFEGNTYNYLNTFNAILNNFLFMVNKDDEYYRQNKILIIGTKKHDGRNVVMVHGDTYGEYLNDQTIDPIIGYGILKPETSSRVGLTSFLAELDQYQSAYEKMMHNDQITNQLEVPKNTRLAIVFAVKDVLENMSESEVGRLAYDREDIYVDVNEFIMSNKINDVDILNVKHISRAIAGTFFFAEEDFLDFIRVMEMFDKLNKNATAEEIATMTVTRFVVTELLNQVNVSTT